MNKVIYIFIFFYFYQLNFSCAQLFNNEKKFSMADTLRGTLSPVRSCYDVYFYHLDLRIDTLEKTINGSNKICFTVVNQTNLIQIDLFDNMDIRKIILDDSLQVEFNREFNAVFVSFPFVLDAGTQHSLTVFYGGKPVNGRLLPWDGGFKWTKDEENHAWIGVACQGVGASLWWPNKDHQSDEPDSMLIAVSVPDGLINVSNGRLRRIKELRGGYKRYEWFVSHPINNYNVTINIGNYTHFNDQHINGSDTLTLDYYVMPYNLVAAKNQFKQVEKMLVCFEKYFGKYPFYKDGYKLVETPYLGMEHQSAIAYGNKYMTGYYGSDYSGIGLNFDYIIVHESAHEWWGNNITTKDIADMWIHEGFASYAEVLYVECVFDSSTAAAYTARQKVKILNRKPLIGPYGVNEEGPSDMYAKGSLLLSTLRNVIHNDSLWFSIIMGIQNEFRYQTITSLQIENYISEKSHIDLHLFFDQYLRNTDIPELQIIANDKKKPNNIEYRWHKVVTGFNMPVRIYTGNNQSILLYPTENWQQMIIENFNKKDFRVADDLFYIKVKME